MARDTAAIGTDVVIGSNTPDVETTVEALIRAYNRLPLDTNLTDGDTVTWDATAGAWVAGSGSSFEGFRAYRSTVQTIAAATFTTIIFDTEVLDEGGDYNPVTGEWTAPATGWYDVATNVNLGVTADGERCILRLLVNAVENMRLVDISSGNAAPVLIGAGRPIHLTAGDVVKIQAYRNNGGDINGVNYQTFFTAKRVV